MSDAVECRNEKLSMYSYGWNANDTTNGNDT